MVPSRIDCCTGVKTFALSLALAVLVLGALNFYVERRATEQLRRDCEDVAQAVSNNFMRRVSVTRGLGSLYATSLAWNLPRSHVARVANRVAEEIREAARTETRSIPARVIWAPLIRPKHRAYFERSQLDGHCVYSVTPEGKPVRAPDTADAYAPVLHYSRVDRFALGLDLLSHSEWAPLIREADALQARQQPVAFLEAPFDPLGRFSAMLEDGWPTSCGYGDAVLIYKGNDPRHEVTGYGISLLCVPQLLRESARCNTGEKWLWKGMLSLQHRTNGKAREWMVKIGEGTVAPGKYRQTVLLDFPVGGVLTCHPLKEEVQSARGTLLGWATFALTVLTILNTIFTATLNGELKAREEALEALKVQNRRIEAMDRARMEFVSFLCHELRNPLQSIISLTELAKEDMEAQRKLGSAVAAVNNIGTGMREPDRRLGAAGGGKSEDGPGAAGEGFLNIIAASADAMLSILNDVLEMTRLEAHKIQLEALPFDVREFISSVVDPYIRSRSPKVEISYHVDPAVPKRVLGDSHRLRQILTNLMSNAVKFTDSGSVRLRVWARDQPPTEPDARLASGALSPDLAATAPTPAEAKSKKLVWLSFEVTDTGIGMSEKTLKQLFIPFTQASLSIARTHGGSGLGLSIVSRLLVLMNGHVSVESKEGVGSRFTVSAPFEVVEPAPSSNSAEATEESEDERKEAEESIAGTAVTSLVADSSDVTPTTSEEEEGSPPVFASPSSSSSSYDSSSSPSISEPPTPKHAMEETVPVQGDQQQQLQEKERKEKEEDEEEEEQQAKPASPAEGAEQQQQRSEQVAAAQALPPLTPEAKADGFKSTPPSVRGLIRSVLPSPSTHPLRTRSISETPTSVHLRSSTPSMVSPFFRHAVLTATLLEEQRRHQQQQAEEEEEAEAEEQQRDRMEHELLSLARLRSLDPALHHSEAAPPPEEMRPPPADVNECRLPRLPSAPAALVIPKAVDEGEEEEQGEEKEEERKPSKRLQVVPSPPSTPAAVTARSPQEEAPILPSPLPSPFPTISQLPSPFPSPTPTPCPSPSQSTSCSPTASPPPPPDQPAFLSPFSERTSPPATAAVAAAGAAEGKDKGAVGAVAVKKKRILLAEDNLVNSKLVAALLRRSGYEVEAVENGRDAVNLIVQNEASPSNRFDAAILDVNMPVMKGDAAARALREKGIQIPLIALSGNVLKSEQAKCLQAGMDYFLPKPVKREQLLATIAKAISRYNSGDEEPMSAKSV